MTRPDDIYRGYVDLDLLPCKAGDTVCFHKGARLHSMHPRKKGWCEAVRAQEVMVHHILPGRSISLGDLYVRDEGETFYPTVKLKEVAKVAVAMGFEHAWRDADTTFAWLQPFCIRKDTPGSARDVDELVEWLDNHDDRTPPGILVSPG